MVWFILFPFTLKDKAKNWLEKLAPLSISTWAKLQALFLKKFFHTHNTISLKKQISTFIARECEKFHQCWDGFMNEINACPHHWFEKLTPRQFLL